ncbi:hypothetical protein [Streptomyces bikiniensis]|uniref:hypothetical protein n=1 Tax=Streptomyces bikiniensis TaxID=1896 RepID=UPI000AFB40B0|nr:hypothetical protein [Streptomyces bikiniensis]
MTTSSHTTAERAGAPITTSEKAPVRRRRTATAALYLLAVAGLLVSIVTASLFGSANIRPLDVVSTILRHIGLGGSPADWSPSACSCSCSAGGASPVLPAWC